MNCFKVVSLICCVSAILADQLPHPLQLFYLTPNNVGIIPSHQAASSYVTAEKMRTTGEKSSNVHTKQHLGNEELVEGETSQFHTQDGKGRALFGYTTPDQARIESRSEDGTVRGSYSYLDAWGKAIKVHYWDDGTGFHAAGNNLPGLYSEVPQPVQDTPEITAAKEQHYQLFQQALAAAVASTAETDPSKGQKPQQTHSEQGLEHEGVVVESDDPGSTAEDDLKELTRYPNLHMFPQNLFDPTHVHDANREAVIVDNPSITPDTSGNSLRTAKTLQAKSADESTAVTDEMAQFRVPGGFFYSFSHPFPLYLQVRTMEEGTKDYADNKDALTVKDDLSVSQKAVLFGAIPIAAVHDAQVPSHLKDSIKNYQVMPLYIEISD